MNRINAFTVENWKHKFLPREDAYRHSESGNFSVISVADGITRDPTNGTLPDVNKLSGKIRFRLGYPRPSPAFYVASIFCKGFDSNLNLVHSQNNKIGEDQIFEAFRLSNQVIRNINGNFFPNPDYLKNDLAGCVASGAVINGRDIFYGYIADCGFCVFDGKGDLKFKTVNEGPNSKGSIDEDVFKKHGTSFELPEGRKIIRSLYRNNPAEPLSYGALTGETSALEYIRTGHFELKEGDIPMVFTDGLEQVIQSGEFADRIRARDFTGIKKLCRRKVKTEGSLIYAIG